MQRLDKQYKGAEEKIGEFRDKLREARLEIAAKDKQLDAARKLLTKLGSERSELAVGTAVAGDTGWATRIQQLKGRHSIK